jgi:hypothetical protein
MKWRTILPLANLVVALCLFAAAYTTSSRYTQPTTSTGTEWTPPQEQLAPPLQIAYAINFPAVLLVNGIFNFHNLAVARIALLIASMLTWFLVGLAVDRRKQPGKRSSAIRIIAALAALPCCLVFYRLTSIFGLHYYVAPLGGMLWCVSLAVFFMRLAATPCRSSVNAMP